MKKSKTILKITSIVILILSICCVLVALGSLFFGVTTATSFTEENSINISQQTIESTQISSNVSPAINIASNSMGIVATVYKGNIIKNLIMDCQSYTKYRPNETTGGIFVSWRRKEELPTGA